MIDNRRCPNATRLGTADGLDDKRSSGASRRDAETFGPNTANP
jgi:hypothetical protein